MGVVLHRIAGLVLLAVIAAGCGTQQPEGAASPTLSSPAPKPSPSLTPEPVVVDEPALAEVGSFKQPLYVTAPPGDPRLFVVEKTGKIKVVSGGQLKPNAFLDVSGKIMSGGEQGLLSLAFAPDYASSGLAYVYYIDTAGDIRVVEYRVSSDPDRLDPGSARLVHLIKHPSFANHDGGLLMFDRQGMLITGTGDGGSGGDPNNRAQNLGEFLGKLLRVNPRNPPAGQAYAIPPDNPFVNRSGARPEIWAYGLRNPWRYSFDPATGDLYLGDVGQNRSEEVNYVPAASIAGSNFGWRVYEGNERFTKEALDENQTVRPVVVYPLSGGNCAVTGGYVYRGEVNTLKGIYLYGDFCAGFVKGFKIAGGAATEQRDFPALSTSELSSFGEDSAGELYIISLGGKVFKIVRK